MADVLLVTLPTTGGLRLVEAELRGTLERAGAEVAVARAVVSSEPRTFALTDLVQARAARRAAAEAIEKHSPRAIIYSMVTTALLWPQPGVIQFDAAAADNRPGRHGIWQRSVERRRFAQAPLVVAQSAGGLEKAPPHRDALIIPNPIEPSGPLNDERDVVALTYAADMRKKGFDRVLRAWTAARRDGETLLVAGLSEGPAADGVEYVGLMEPDDFRALLRRARVYVTAPRREDYGSSQLEALADGAMLVTTEAPGPYAALPIARDLDPRLVGDDLAGALRAALDDPREGYAEKARSAMLPYRRGSVDALVLQELLPRILE